MLALKKNSLGDAALFCKCAERVVLTPRPYDDETCVRRSRCGEGADRERYLFFRLKPTHVQKGTPRKLWSQNFVMSYEKKLSSDIVQHRKSIAYAMGSTRQSVKSQKAFALLTNKRGETSRQAMQSKQLETSLKKFHTETGECTSHENVAN